ncbi:hypothetical protein L2E82_06521 [Cichorium intybus]|uniref:Uncharacterized protein n=1 Tax=Cichorium intybus TaxID=13427 RepID=A0ACB9HAA4_CICIN|nr:hypothetical protein L2E82_06521 [Cichorium intybus]
MAANCVILGYFETKYSHETLIGHSTKCILFLSPCFRLLYVAFIFFDYPQNANKISRIILMNLEIETSPLICI